MSISRVQAATAQANHVAFSAPQAGDLILAWFHRDGSTTAPSLPTGYTTIRSASGGANTNARRLCYKYAVGTETDTGVATNATSSAVAIYRGADLALGFGDLASGGSASTSMAYGTLSMQVSDGTSWVVGFGAHRTATDVGTNVPTGLALASSATDIAVFDSNGGKSSWSSQAATVNANSGWRTDTLEIVARAVVDLGSYVVQHHSTASNENFETGNAFKVKIDPTKAGNCLVLGMALQSGKTTSVADNIGSGTWTKRASNPDGFTTFDNEIWVQENCPAGVTEITVTWNTAGFDFQATVTELRQIATSSAYDTNAVSSASVSGASAITPGALTTATANELIIGFAMVTGWGAGLTGNVMRGARAKSNYLLLGADSYLGVVTFAGIASSSGSNTPGFYEGGTDGWNCLAVALKTSAGAGTAPSSTRVGGVLHSRVGIGTDTIFAPGRGKTMVLMSAYNPDFTEINSITDRLGNVWTPINQGTGTPTGAGYPQGAYFTYATPPGPDLVLTISTTDHGGGVLQFLLYGLEGELLYDTAAYQQGTLPAPGTTGNAPSITPGASGGVMLAVCALTTGPPNAMPTPSGGVLDSVYYTGYTDLGPIDAGDGYGHYYPPSTATVNWTWTDVVLSDGWEAQAVSFKPAVTSGIVCPNRPVLQAVKRAGFY